MELEEIDETLVRLIQALHKINNDDTLKVRQDGHYCLSQQNIKDAVDLANECLLGPNNVIIKKNLDIVKMEDFQIYIGDIDNTGYMTGIIQLSGGDIMFG